MTTQPDSAGVTTQPTDLDLIEAQQGVVKAREDLDDLIHRARVTGVSWTHLGAVLGMTRQGAQRRWGRKQQRH